MACMSLLWMAFKAEKHYISVRKLSDLLLSSLILRFPPMCHLLDDALPSYCKSYLRLDKQITAISLWCEVRGTRALWNFSSQGLIAQAAVRESQDLWDIYQGTVKFFFFVLQMQFKYSCRQHDPRSASDATQGHAHSPSDIHSLQTVRERNECVLLRERVGEGRERGWGCSKSHLPLCAPSKQFTLLCVSAARASFAQPFLLISPICRQLETCCSLAASR